MLKKMKFKEINDGYTFRFVAGGTEYIKLGPHYYGVYPHRDEGCRWEELFNDETEVYAERLINDVLEDLKDYYLRCCDRTCDECPIKLRCNTHPFDDSSFGKKLFNELENLLKDKNVIW